MNKREFKQCYKLIKKLAKKIDTLEQLSHLIELSKSIEKTEVKR